MKKRAIEVSNSGSVAKLVRDALAVSLLSSMLVPAVSLAAQAVLVQQAVLVERNPEPEPQIEGSEGTITVPATEVGTAVNASYVSSGGWAVNGTDFIDASAYLFDMGETSSVSQATLTLPILETFPQNGTTPMQVFYFSDTGVIDHTDYSVGFPEPIVEIDVEGQQQLVVDVTGPINSILAGSRFVGFRVVSAVANSSVSETSVPRWTGTRFRENAQLDFTAGPAASPTAGTPIFDGFTLETPTVEVNTIGEARVQLRLIDPNNLLFQLTEAVVTNPTSSSPELSGLDLLNCSAFSPPGANSPIPGGTSSYSLSSGILDIPNVEFNGDQVAMRLELIEGSDPWIFETLSISKVTSGPSVAVTTDLAGGILVEPTQDFIPLCHGWVLMGDSIRNRMVERNIITGETGATYPFGAIPDQLTLDESTGLVYFTVHPESSRLYKLNLADGRIEHNRTRQTFTLGNFSHTYDFAIRDIAIGESGKIFAIMLEPVVLDPANGIPFTDTGLWLGLMDTDGNFLINSLPLEEPIRIEYDPVLDHVFLTTQSNLATFDFNNDNNNLTFVTGTDIAVGSGCTDFSISPDGRRLAYSCPDGNRAEAEFSIVDMAPDAYFNSDGEWFLGASPVSATFSNDGSILLATDNDKLYFFDAESHLLLEDFELGLLEGETVRKVRYSRDGAYIIVFLQNEVHVSNSKFYYMPTPAITASGLPPQ